MQFEATPGFRGILFCQQRVMTHVLQHVISTDAELAAVLNTACLYASTAPATASLSVTKAQAEERISAFAAGQVNLLICTVVAEVSFLLLSTWGPFMTAFAEKGAQVAEVR